MKRFILPIICLFIITVAPTAAYTANAVFIDRFTVIKNDLLLFEDNFDDGVPPPSAPNFADGNPASYFVQGTLSESGGKVQLDIAGAPIFPSITIGDTTTFFVKSGRLSTSTNPESSAGLKQNATFSVTGVFDLAVPGPNREGYGIELTDRTATNPGNDHLRLEVRRSQDGVVRIRFRRFDFVTGTVTNIASTLLETGHDQIALTLTRATTDNNAISASFAYIDGGVMGPVTNFVPTANIFNGENFTRAAFRFESPVPQISTGLQVNGQDVDLEGKVTTDPVTGITTTDISGTYGDFQVSPIDPSITAKVVAEPTPSVNKLTMTDGIITNTGATTNAITMIFAHTFPVDTSQQRFYGTSMSGTFFNELAPTRLLSGDSITKDDFVDFERFACEFECIVTRQLAPPLPLAKSYTVPPPPAPITANDFAPQTPPQGSIDFVCTTVAGGPCEEFETLRTVVSVTLAPGDSVYLAGTLVLLSATSQANRNEALGALTVRIDIKPGSFPNSINPKSRGRIPVAILSSPAFDATTKVNKSSLTFGRTGNQKSLAFCNKGGEDVNGDGLLDLVCHFDTQASAFQSGNIVGILKGELVSGAPFTAADSVRIVH